MGDEKERCTIKAVMSVVSRCKNKKESGVIVVCEIRVRVDDHHRSDCFLRFLQLKKTQLLSMQEKAS